ncbi:MAG: hypothetical protein JJT77_09280 [Crocinitomicaceae bacterium]|nr:hypothetical protein [Crocinitomicaceae bacterium]
MRAFVSYSINDSDQYILTLLSSELGKKGVVLSQSNDFYTQLSPITEASIKKSQLFIGLITFAGDEKDRVMQEYRVAQINKVPSLLLVEDNVNINNTSGHDLIRFNRSNPDGAVQTIKNRINHQKRKNDQDSESLAWLIGGAAVIALIALIAGNKSK